MDFLGKDELGRRYYVARYAPGCLRKLPWGSRRFDCGILVCRSAVLDDVERCIQEVVHHNNDWVCTYGADAEAWHDRVDHASVQIGRQKQVGDGIPMTAWFDEVASLTDLDLVHCYGAGPFLLILVGFPASVRERRGFERKLQPSKVEL